jgi:predicted RNA-binding protein with PIN domain
MAETGPMGARRQFLAEAGGALGIMGVFLGIALVGWQVGSGGRAGPPEPAYPRGPMEAAGSDTRHEAPAATWLIDGFNVLNVALLRGAEREAFWRDASRRLLIDLAGQLDETGAEVVVVFDGSRPSPGDEGLGPPPGKGRPPKVVFARPADDWLLRRIRSAPDPAGVVVVTADRQLADRARHRGARVVAPAMFVERCRNPG